MQLIKGVLFILLSATMTTAWCWAEPTLSGSTGIIEMPTAETLQYKEWNGAVSVHPGATVTSSSTIKYKLNIATFPNMELGIIGNTNQEGVFINAKVAFAADTAKNALKMVLGIQNLSSFYNTNMYMVVSKRMTPDFNLHLGFSTDLSQKLVPKFMAGTEVVVGKSASLLADVTGAEDSWKFNAGASFSFTPQVSVGVYVIDLFNGMKDQNSRNVVGQLSWTNFL